MTKIDNQFFMSEKKSIEPNQCPVTYCMSKIGGKWKPIILFVISLSSEERQTNRFGEMHRSIEGISKQMLTKQLRELERDKILHRKVYAEIPPKVEYSITELGQTLMPVIGIMRDWGEKNMPQSMVS